MVLLMIRRHVHSKTGVYWLRKVVPFALRSLVGRRELVQTLGTKDASEAKRKAGEVSVQFEAIIANARAATRADAPALTQRVCPNVFHRI